jgi:precorrin-6Y C5,15-methyltransferase (decarboxylating)
MKITLVGAGMGSPRALTREAEDALRAADAVIAAPRLLAALQSDAEKFAEALPGKAAALIAAHPHWRAAAVLLSGDPGFHSGAKKLLELLRGGGHEITVLPGISTPQYFAAKLRRPWQSFRLVSAHGAPCDVLAEVLNHPETFFLTDGATTPRAIAQTLCAAGLGAARLAVGENLSSPSERIATGTAETLRDADFAQPAVVLVDNDKTFTRAPGASGIPDADFIRGAVPMTKREVRAVALALLALRPEDIAYDIGAGTGSVAVEMSLAARRGPRFRRQILQLLYHRQADFHFARFREQHW